MPATYEAIATTTSSSGSYTFSSVPSTYTDLILIVQGISTGTNINYGLRFNGDGANNYSSVRFYGDGGASTTADRLTNFSNILSSNLAGTQGLIIHHIQNYKNTTMNKTVLVRSNTSSLLYLNTGMWRNTAAITSVEFLSTTGNTMNPATLTLYGIKAA
jgi:hypothetical protein